MLSLERPVWNNVSLLSDEMRAGEMHTAAAGAAELGEELGNAHDAVCLSGFAGQGSLPGECRRAAMAATTIADQIRIRTGSSRGALRRAMGYHAAMGYGVECPDRVSPVLDKSPSQLSGSFSTALDRAPAC